MTTPSPAPQHRPPAALNVLHIEPGTRLRLVGDVIVEVMTNPQDGIWLLVRYLEVPDDPARIGSEDMVFAEDVLGTV